MAQFKLIFLSLSGHGDQRHAVHRDWVCKEWRNVWWVWRSPRYSDTCTQHLPALWPRRLLSPQTSWHHTAAWAKMRPERSSGRSWQPWTTATDTTSFTAIWKLRTCCWMQTWTSNWPVGRPNIVVSYRVSWCCPIWLIAYISFNQRWICFHLKKARGGV